MLLRKLARRELLTRFAAIAVLAPPTRSVWASDKLTLTGSSTIAPLALEIAKRFEKLHRGVRIDVQTGGSSRGLNDTRSGVAHIGLASRALKANESDLQAHTIALDGISIIVHRSNSLLALSDQQIRDIYSGRLRDWASLGGRPGAITVVNKAEGRSTLDLFLAYFQLKNSEIKPHIVIGDNQQGVKSVAANPGAIGYVSIGTAAVEAQLGTAIRLLPMAGVAPTVEAVRLGRFPLSRPLNLVTKGKPGELAQRFISFAQSSAVADLVEAQFFVTPAAR
jgi:phosphate transport system substrate-binding protein